MAFVPENSSGKRTKGSVVRLVSGFVPLLALCDEQDADYDRSRPELNGTGGE
jgi:hypothetical protein